MAVHSSITFFGRPFGLFLERNKEPVYASGLTSNCIDKELTALPGTPQCRLDRQRRRPVSPWSQLAASLRENKSAGLLPFGKHCIFHSLADAKLQGRLGGDLNRLTCCRIASLTGFSF